MSAGLPLFILSILAIIILVVWSFNGRGNRNYRFFQTSVIIFLLVASWAALLFFGVFHPVGSWAMGLGFIISIGAFFVPIINNKLQRNENT